MQWSTKLFSIRGIDVRVHATFALMVALGATQWGARHGSRGAAFGAAFTLALFACVLLHELGHSLVAQKFGLKVREILLLPIGGVASLVGRPKSPAQEVLIALAGPAVNIVLAVLFGAAFWATGHHLSDLPAFLTSAKPPSLPTLLLLLTTGNVSLALFNMLPVFPLDGGRVLRALLEMRWGALRATKWAAGLGQIAAVGLVAFALYTGHLILAIIAVLVFMAAAREALNAQLQGPLTQLRAGELAELPAVELDGFGRIHEAVPYLLRSPQPAFPVVQGGEVLGVVLRSDLIHAAEQGNAGMRSIRTIMRGAPRLDAHLPVCVALHKLAEAGEPVGVVVDDGQLLGLLQESQVLAKLAQTPRIDWQRTRAQTTSPQIASPETRHIG